MQRVFVLVGDRLARTIRAGHHQNFGRACGKQQMMQRRVGQHHAELVIFRRNSRQFGLRRREDDGPGDGFHQGFRLGRKVDQAARDLDILHHQGERFFLSEFSGAQGGDSFCIFRVAGQMVAAQSLHSQNLARSKIMHCSSNRFFISAHNFIARSKKIVGSARRARDGLRVKAPIRRVAILGCAGIVQRPIGHRGIGAVVRQASNDAVAGTAVRAIDVRIVIAAILRDRKVPAGNFRRLASPARFERWAAARRVLS